MKTSTIRELKRIERLVYPPSLRMMKDIHTTRELRDYCEGEPYVLLRPGQWYLLYTKEGGEEYSGEIVDLACIPPTPFAFLRQIYQHLSTEFAGQAVIIDARESTSWPIVQEGHRHGWLRILRSESGIWSGERFYEALIAFGDKRVVKSMD